MEAPNPIAAGSWWQDMVKHIAGVPERHKVTPELAAGVSGPGAVRSC